MILITTSRKPNMSTRALARNIANLIPQSKYVTRGKKNTDGIIEEARTQGYARIAVVTDYKGNPGKIQFIKTDGKSWDWAEELKIKSCAVIKKEKARDIRVTGEEKQKIKELFDIRETPDSEFELKAGKNELTFLKNEEEIVRIKLI